MTEVDDYWRRKRMHWFLLPLSMTCRAMRLRLLPWILERIKCFELAPSWSSEGHFPSGLNAIMRALGADIYLSAGVKYLRALLHCLAGARSVSSEGL